MKKIKEFWNRIKNFFKKGKPAAPAAETAEPGVKKKKKSWISTWPYWLRRSVWAVFLTGVLTCFFVFLAFFWFSFIYLDDEFDLSGVDTSLNYTSVVYAVKDGAYVEAETLHTSENRIWTDLENIPEDLQWAFIAIEDKRFYQHSGVDLIRTASAVLNFFNPSSSSTYGGSTITQQVIKNITGEDEQTVTRKIQEIRRAWYLEREYKKDQILEVYLNTIYLSQGCYGVETAAEVYFGKTVNELTLLECASLASITKLPTRYDPVQNPENNLERAHTVIDEMLKLGKITEEEANEAKAQELVLHVGESKENESGGTAINSYFVDQVISDVISALVNEKGYSQSYAHSLVYSGGIQIYSTMDLDIQSAIDKVYSSASNFPKITSPLNGEAPQSAMVIIDNSTGAVVGMAGGIGEKTTARGLNRATQSYLQPGSCMKPIGTYGPAIEYETKIDGVRVAPGMMLLDQGVRQINGNWWPKNYDEVTERLMTIQAGLDQSKNTIAVRVNNALGAKTAFNFLKNNLGVTTLIAGSGYDENDQAMALGGLTKGISVLQITAAYAAFPADGTYTKPYTFTKICDQNGRVILENRVESNTAMEKNTAAVINQMLQHAATYGTGSVANFGKTAICGKTGTTNDDKDRWFVGYTKYYTAGVWFGYDQPATVYYSGRNPAAMAWRSVMSEIHTGLAYQSFPAATGLVEYTLCTESGKLAGPSCGNTLVGQFFADSPPTATCDLCAATPPEEETPVDPQQPENPDDTVNPPAVDQPGGTDTPGGETKPGENTQPDEGGDQKPEEGDSGGTADSGGSTA